MPDEKDEGRTGAGDRPAEPAELPPSNDAGGEGTAAGERRHRHKDDEHEHALRSRLKKREEALEETARERDEWRDKHLRALAEMENLRKRLAREMNEYRQFALTDALKNLLQILDGLERAVASEDEAGNSLREGLRMILRQFLDFLAKNGVTPVPEALGSRFDPGLHQALAIEESDEVDEPQVIEELQRGYKIHDRLLRPALVKVLVPRKGGPTETDGPAEGS